ncbi:MAG: Uncharacterised protein [Formosa sp. Hel1_33_131]|nr:MAG: Uncharacterised protein [Formosa sp. Hel1_33_131]
MQLNTSIVVCSYDDKVTAKRRRFKALYQRVYYEVYQIVRLKRTDKKGSYQNQSKLILIYRDSSTRTPSIL